MPFAFGGTGTGGGGGLDIEVVQALPVYQEDIRVAPVFYFRRSDNTYHQAFSEPLAADEAASMTRNVLAQANITGNATWRGTVDNLNDIVTPAADDWAFEHRAGHNRLWWYDGTTWYGSESSWKAKYRDRVRRRLRFPTPGRNLRHRWRAP